MLRGRDAGDGRSVLAILLHQGGLPQALDQSSCCTRRASCIRCGSYPPCLNTLWVQLWQGHDRCLQVLAGLDHSPA